MDTPCVKYITELNNQELTFLIDPYDSGSGMFVTKDATVVDLQETLPWLRIYEDHDAIVRSRGVMRYDGHIFKAFEFDVVAYEPGLWSLNMYKCHITELQNAPQINTFQLGQLLLNQLKKAKAV